MLTVKFSDKENTVCNCCRKIEHILFCIRPFASQTTWKRWAKCWPCHPWKKFCRRPCL